VCFSASSFVLAISMLCLHLRRANTALKEKIEWTFSQWPEEQRPPAASRLHALTPVQYEARCAVATGNASSTTNVSASQTFVVSEKRKRTASSKD